MSKPTERQSSIYRISNCEMCEAYADGEEDFAPVLVMTGECGEEIVIPTPAAERMADIVTQILDEQAPEARAGMLREFVEGAERLPGGEK